MTAPELTPDVFTAVADWIMRDGGRDQLAELVPQPGMLADDFYARAQELREKKAEDERLGALVYTASGRATDFSLATPDVRAECIVVAKAVRDDTIERQKQAAKGADPWPPYKQPTMGDLRDLGEQLVWHQQNSPTGVTGIAQIALSRVNRLYELRLRDTPLTDEVQF